MGVDFVHPRGARGTNKNLVEKSQSSLTNSN